MLVALESKPPAFFVSCLCSPVLPWVSILTCPHTQPSAHIPPIWLHMSGCHCLVREGAPVWLVRSKRDVTSSLCGHPLLSFGYEPFEFILWVPSVRVPFEGHCSMQLSWCGIVIADTSKWGRSACLGDPALRALVQSGTPLLSPPGPGRGLSGPHEEGRVPSAPEAAAAQKTP